MTPTVDQRVFPHYTPPTVLSTKEQLELIEELKEEIEILKENNRRLKEELKRK